MIPPERPPTDAEEERTLAQAAESYAAAEESKAAAQHWLALTRAAAAEAEIAEASLERARNNRDRERAKRRAELAMDIFHRTYYLQGAIDRSSVQLCIDRLSYWDRTQEPSDITIVINSGGGSVIDGLALFDHIVNLRNKGWKVTTVVRGYSASMAGILLQAGTIRKIGSESFILIHEITTVAYGKIGEIEDEVAFVKKIQDRILTIFASRSQGKISKATLKRKWKRTDWWLDSTEALKYGIVDEIG